MFFFALFSSLIYSVLHNACLTGFRDFQDANVWFCGVMAAEMMKHLLLGKFPSVLHLYARLNNVLGCSFHFTPQECATVAFLFDGRFLLPQAAVKEFFPHGEMT